MNPLDQPDHKAIDLEKALSRMGGDQIMLRDLTEIFLRESPKWLNEVETAIRESNAKLLFRAAHDIKGSVDIFGASSAAETAARLEKMGRHEDLANADEALGALKAELVWVRQALEDYLEESKT
ncbi:MAG: Hpt domain-containing protein [Bradymonadaceae bacterium]